jgi:transposase InsO family protein
MMESFWGTLKEECIGEVIFSSRKEARTALFDYIEVFYNRKRRHSSLGYLSPVDFEKQG